MAPRLDDDLIGTLSDSDVISDEEQVAQESTISANGKKRKLESKKQSAVKKQKEKDVQTETSDDDVDSEFEFGLENGAALLDDYETFLGGTSFSSKATFDVEAAATRRRHDLEPRDDEVDEQEDAESEGSFDGFGGRADMAEDEDEDVESSDGDDPAVSDNEEEDDRVDDTQNKREEEDASNSAGEEQSDTVELERRNAFFASDAPTSNDPSKQSFHAMSLSRPILKGLAEIGFTSPTPVQSKAIPVALAGKDIVGGAVTGSGKTAAFIIPILERLLYRPKKSATTRVVILTPTRELAIQCLNVAKKLASFTDITFGSAIGGMNIREQERDLKRRPDIVIATPGRFIDLERNYSCFAVNTIEILVLDEADRMLEEGFADELNEILTKIPKSRQTMLFSATMTSRVDDLIRVGLRHPVSILVNPHHQTVAGLEQEFVRLRAGREEKRLAYLMCLCSKVHTDRVIIFFRQKKDAHRIRVLFALCNLKAAELHGNMTQEQRIQAIESFRSGKVSFLLATDLASRGLDIKGIETVINYEAPQSLEIYLHRVGRTARAGKSGRACTLTAEPDRKIIKAVVKVARAQGAHTKQRIIDAKEADEWHKRCEDLQSEVDAILKEEKEERAMQNTEREVIRADNIVTHKSEIFSRPKKTWFESSAEKKAAKIKGAETLNGPSAEKPGKKKIGGKLSNKQKKRLRDRDERKDAGMWKKGKGNRAER